MILQTVWDLQRYCLWYRAPQMSFTSLQHDYIQQIGWDPRLHHHIYRALDHYKKSKVVTPVQCNTFIQTGWDIWLRYHGYKTPDHYKSHLSSTWFHKLCECQGGLLLEYNMAHFLRLRWVYSCISKGIQSRIIKERPLTRVQHGTLPQAARNL